MTLTREQWLNAFADSARPTFKAQGFPLPDKLRISVGFTSRGAKSKTIGQCWSSTASADQHFEIFIHPGYQSDGNFMADILTHELCHAATPGAQHGPIFKRCATRMGLVGKMRSAGFPDKTPPEWAQAILDVLGAFPAADLTGGKVEGGPKKQKSRLVRAECMDCQLVFRITAKYIVEREELRCPDVECSGELQMGG